MLLEETVIGDHNIFFYNSSREKHRVLFSNLKAGLYRNGSALYIASGESVEQVQVKMRDFGLRPDDPLKLRIVTSHQFYTPDGEFHANRVVEQYRSLIIEAAEKGFEGLYVSADAADTFDYLSKKLVTESWLRYENSLGRSLKFCMEAICAYRTDQIETTSQALLQLIQSHRNTITSKTANFADNQKLYMDAVTEELNIILGEEATRIIFHYLEKTFNLSRNQIPDKMEALDKALESIFGDAVKIIKQRIMKNLHRKLEL